MNEPNTPAPAQAQPQHTPGPWIWGLAPASKSLWWITPSAGPLGDIAHVDGQSCDVRSRAENEANARLLAAAPQLLAALTDLLFAVENADETGYVTDHGFIDVDKIHEAARASISAATGKDGAK